MASVIIDTASWIDLSKPKFDKILSSLEDLTKDGLLELLTNDIIIAEWYRNKASTIKTVQDSIKTHGKSAKEISKFLKEPQKSTFDGILINYLAEEDNEIRIANEHISRVEALLNHATVVTIEDELKVRMADRAVDKKAPFHNSKNNMADSLIIFSAIDWVHLYKKIQTTLIFVSANYKEFNEPGSKGGDELHHEILQDSRNVDIVFTNDIGRIITVKEQNVVDDETWAEVQLWRDIYDQYEISRGK